MYLWGFATALLCDPMGPNTMKFELSHVSCRSKAEVQFGVTKKGEKKKKELILNKQTTVALQMYQSCSDVKSLQTFRFALNHDSLYELFQLVVGLGKVSSGELFLHHNSLVLSSVFNGLGVYVPKSQLFSFHFSCDLRCFQLSVYSSPQNYWILSTFLKIVWLLYWKWADRNGHRLEMDTFIHLWVKNDPSTMFYSTRKPCKWPFFFLKFNDFPKVTLTLKKNICFIYISIKAVLYRPTKVVPGSFLTQQLKSQSE